MARTCSVWCALQRPLVRNGGWRSGLSEAQQEAVGRHGNSLRSERAGLGGLIGGHGIWEEGVCAGGKGQGRAQEAGRHKWMGYRARRRDGGCIT